MNTSRTPLLLLAAIALGLLVAPHVHAQQPRRVGEVAVPEGCVRVAVDTGSFGAWLRALPLRGDTRIASYKGTAVSNPIYDVLAVVDMRLLFARDLEQCADFAMRFWAEYHRSSGRLDDLFLFEYGGRRTRFRNSGLSYESFLRRAFAGSNSHSLKKGCTAITAEQLAPGDLIVQNERGGIGHVSVIMDACTARDGERLYLIGFSFMPAQEFHIERASRAHGRGGWFTLAGYTRWLDDNLPLGDPVLRRFPR
jgi:hypothetical protein